jgi:hypothetical protein
MTQFLWKSGFMGAELKPESWWGGDFQDPDRECQCLGWGKRRSHDEVGCTLGRNHRLAAVEVVKVWIRLFFLRVRGNYKQFLQILAHMKPPCPFSLQFSGLFRNKSAQVGENQIQIIQLSFGLSGITKGLFLSIFIKEKESEGGFCQVRSVPGSPRWGWDDGGSRDMVGSHTQHSLVCQWPQGWKVCCRMIGAISLVTAWLFSHLSDWSHHPSALLPISSYPMSGNDL